jgi:hypothetical protein
MPFDGISGDSVLAILLAGREKIERGWCKGAALDDFGRVCAGHAINMFSVCRTAEQKQASVYLERELPYKVQWGMIQVYNDSPATTHADILALYDRAIATRMSEINV